MFPTPEKSQAKRLELMYHIEDQIKKRRELKAKVASGEITEEEWQASMDKIRAEINCPIRNNINQKFGSMGTGLDGRGDPILTSEVRVKTDTYGRPITYTTLPEIIDGDMPDIWICVDGNKVDTQMAENKAHLFRELIHHAYAGEVQVHFSSGPTAISMILNEPLVLEAQHNGFCIKKCPKALTHNGLYLHYPPSPEEKKVSILDLVVDEDINKVAIFAITYPDSTPEELEAQSHCVAKMMQDIRTINRKTEVAIVPIDIPVRQADVIVDGLMMGYMLTSWVTINVVGDTASVSKARGHFPSVVGYKVVGL
ncbi:hypothetical protein OBP_294 [Pseudomonas phage OBP]|uniref:hypothetical protein n=1 Tax=Pseudomonas phage OBP TaxID=1124849 RepID=UPI000240D641|nr:hypothetical protein OBP_294 [Pseudomonas phage OBP]AEV89731.1 hypothetical protein OBP_294 [Pseudomonas phage OBP]